MKCEKCDKEINEEKKKTIQIKNRYTNEVIFESETATTIKETVEEAVKLRADLSGANLSGANLSGANLSKANLWKANLSGANLSGANLSRANLMGANLSGADLSGANLSGANLFYCKMDKKVFKQITEEWFEWKVE